MEDADRSEILVCTGTTWKTAHHIDPYESLKDEIEAQDKYILELEAELDELRND